MPFASQILDGHCKGSFSNAVDEANRGSRDRRTTAEEDKFIQELYETQKRIKEEQETAGIQSFIISELLDGLLEQKSRPDLEVRHVPRPWTGSQTAIGHVKRVVVVGLDVNVASFILAMEVM